MTDPVQSGGDAPAADPTSAASPGGNAQAFGTFSSTRGSGLARGKRSTTPAAASAAPARTGEYKPTALEVITPEREYKNPFGGPSADLSAIGSAKEEVSAKADVPAEPAAVPPPASPAEIAEEKETETVAEVEVPRAPSADLFPLAPENNDTGPAVPTKAELNILPPAETKRPALNWENAPSRDERPTFRPEPRRDQPRPESRDPRPEARSPRPEGRDPRREPRDFRPESRDDRRESAPSHSPRPAAPQKSGGFLGWLKGLFGGKPAAQPAPAPETRREEHGFERDGHRRRRRGGRGRHFGEHGGERQGQPGSPAGGEARSHGGERHGDEQGGHRPRRHRGGRGRGRGDQGGGGGYRSEGHQGGGHI